MFIMDNQNKKIFATLFFSLFIAITGVGIVVPLLPVYAHSIGATGFYISLIFASFSISRTFFLPLFGSLSDKKGRKPFITFGLLVYAIVSIAFMNAKSVNLLIAIRFIQGIASAMILPVTQAYVGEITPKGNEGFFMGLFNVSVFASLSIGPILGGFINDKFSLQTAFICMGILSFIGFIMSWFMLPSVKAEKIMQKTRTIIPWRTLIIDKEIIGIFIFRFVYTVCIGLIWSFLPIFADSEFHLSSSHIGILIMLGVFTSGILHTPMGIVSDKLNKKVLIITGGIIITISVYSFSWSICFMDLFIANLLFGIGGGISMPSLMAIAVIKGNEVNAMGSIMSFITMAHSLGMLVGSLAGGVIMDTLNLRKAFPFGAIIMIIGTITFMVCFNKTKGKPIF